MIAHLEGISIARHVMITYHITTYHTGAKTTGLPPAQRPCHKQQSSRVLAKEHWSSSIKRVYVAFRWWILPSMDKMAPSMDGRHIHG